MLALIYFIPVLTTLMWFVTFVLKADRQRRRTYTVALAGEFCFYILYSVFVLPETDFLLMVKLDAVLVPVSLLAAAFLAMHIRQLRTGSWSWGEYFLLSLPAIVIGSAVGVLYYLIGFNTAASIASTYFSTGVWPEEYSGDLYSVYRFFDYFMKHAAALAMILAVVASSVTCIIKEKPGWKTVISWFTIAEMVLLIPSVIKGRQFMVEHHHLSEAIAFLIGVAVHFRSQTEFTHKYESLQIWGKIRPSRNNQATDTPKARKSLSALLEAKVARLMDEEQVFKDNSLTVDSLAGIVGVSRSTMSAMISSAYGENFRDYLNRRRIEYSKEYMLAHPKATQEAIAAECGFKDGNLFNRKFKQLEGETPLSWLVRNYKG